LEMNTRLQVEHPITEMVTGIDLAAWQIRLAAGEPLTFEQQDLSQRGHALECRIYAEDPQQDNLPSIGEISFYRHASGPGVRVDDGIESGTLVSQFYDPMLAKVITWGDDRSEAIRKMIRALQDTVVLGVTTNIPYLLDILSDEGFVQGDISTKFLQERMDPWKPSADTSNSTWLAVAALESLKEQGSNKIHSAENTEKPNTDIWGVDSGWRNVSG